VNVKLNGCAFVARRLSGVVVVRFAGFGTVVSSLYTVTGSRYGDELLALSLALIRNL
jgi:hypothetical protein